MGLKSTVASLLESRLARRAGSMFSSLAKREGSAAIMGGLFGSAIGGVGAVPGAFGAAAAVGSMRALPTVLSEGVAKTMYAATFMPLAMVGAPVLKVGGAIGSGLLGSSAAIGRESFSAWSKGLATPRGRRAAVLGLGMAGLGLGLYGSMGMTSRQVPRRYDPANTMGLSQSLHQGFRR